MYLNKRQYLNFTNPLLYLVIISILSIIYLVGSSYINKNSDILTNNQFSNSLNNEDNNIDDKILNIVVRSGDTFRAILKHTHLNQNQIQNLQDEINKVFNIKKLSIGQKFTFAYDKDVLNNQLIFKSLKLKPSIDKEVEIYTDINGKFLTKITQVIFKKNIARAQATIKNSFIATTNQLKLPYDSISEIVKAYSYDIDFQRDIQSGATIDVFYEKFYDEESNFSHNGDILYLSLTLENKKFNLYKYKNKSGNFEYYNSDGSNVKKELLRTPINIVKISSGFGSRKHPILGYTRMHKGVDFAAPIGTPILAAGNGIVEEMGRKGAYGNYIKIKHDNNYSTAYAHASFFNKSLRKGSNVKQGDVIAYVGTTGMSSGPHLHYEVLVNNQQVNPIKLKVSSGIKLSGEELKNFDNHKNKVLDLLNRILHNGEISYSSLYNTTI